MTSFWPDLRRDKRLWPVTLLGLMACLAGAVAYLSGSHRFGVLFFAIGAIVLAVVAVELLTLRPTRNKRQLRADRTGSGSEAGSASVSKAAHPRTEVIGCSATGTNLTIYASAMPGVAPDTQRSLLTAFDKQVIIIPMAAKGGEGKTTLLALCAQAHAEARRVAILVLDSNPKGNLERKFPVSGEQSGKTIIDLANACQKGEVKTQADFAGFATIIDGCFFVHKPVPSQRELTPEDIDEIIRCSREASFPFVYMDGANVIKGAVARVVEIAHVILMAVSTKGEAETLAREDVATILELHPEEHIVMVAIERAPSSDLEILRTMGEFRWPASLTAEAAANGKPDLQRLFARFRPSGLHVRALRYHPEIANGLPLWWNNLPKSLKTQVRDITAVALGLVAGLDVPFQPPAALYNALPVPPSMEKMSSSPVPDKSSTRKRTPREAPSPAGTATDPAPASRNERNSRQTTQLGSDANGSGSVPMPVSTSQLLTASQELPAADNGYVAGVPSAEAEGEAVLTTASPKSDYPVSQQVPDTPPDLQASQPLPQTTVVSSQSDGDQSIDVAEAYRRVHGGSEANEDQLLAFIGALHERHPGVLEDGAVRVDRLPELQAAYN